MTNPYRDAFPAIANAFETADQYATALEAAVDRVRAVHQPVTRDECCTECSCGHWSHVECLTVRALDGT